MRPFPYPFNTPEFQHSLDAQVEDPSTREQQACGMIFLLLAQCVTRGEEESEADYERRMEEMKEVKAWLKECPREWIESLLAAQRRAMEGFEALALELGVI